MTADTEATAPRGRKGSARTLVGIGALVVLLGAMALDTTVVVMGSEADNRGGGFQPQQFGQEKFPEIQKSVETRAVEAPALAEAIAEDQSAAAEKYGVGDGIGPVVPVKFTGVAGEEKSGIYTVDVEGLPDDVTVRVQTGPAINGTELRDATGNIAFGEFKNQIEYQNAGAAINDEMKRQVLADIDTANLTGKTITVTGAFKLINPKNWLVTPVRMSVQ